MMTGSQIIIENGGNLINEGQIEMLGTFDGTNWTSSELEFHDGANLKMEHTDAEINFNGGDLWVMEDAIFTFTHPTGPSGHLKFSQPGVHIYGEDNSEIRLEGDYDGDPILYVEEDADFWNDTQYDLDYVSFKKGFVTMDENARIVSNQEFLISDCKVYAKPNTASRGLVTFNNTLITYSDLNEVPISAYQIGTNEAKLWITHTEINGYDQSSTSPAIYVEGRHYYFVNSELNTVNKGTGKATLRSTALHSKAYIANSTFDGDLGTHATVEDDSDVLVRIKDSEFLDTQNGVIKESGELGLRCNDFTGNKIAVTMNQNSILQAGQFDAHYGYNIFTTQGSSNIVFDNSLFAHMYKGYNDFSTNSTSAPIFDGSINFYGNVFTNPTLSAQFNAWDGTTTSPSAGNYDLYNFVMSDDIAVVNTSASIDNSCGENDPTGGKPIIDGANNTETNVLPNIEIGSWGGPKKLDDWIGDAMKDSELYDSTGNNATSIELLKDILTYDFSDTTYDDERDEIELALLYAYYQMKYILHNSFENGDITEDDNVEEFETSVGYFVEAINVKSDLLDNPSHKQLRFAHEMDKAHLFRLIGHRDIAIDILENAEKCDLDSLDQAFLNKWKFIFEEEVEIIEYGYEAYLTDTVFTDSSGYTVPRGQSISEYEFTSTIYSVDSIVYTDGCSRKPEIFEEATDEISLKIYPNPSQDVFNIEYYIPEESNGEISIYSVDGKIIKIISCFTGHNYLPVDFSKNARGVYLYTLTVDGKHQQSGKMILN